MKLSKTITQSNRADLVRAVQLAPIGAHLQLVDDLRSLQQNKRMWAMLTDIAAQCTIGGEYFEPNAWKAAFMKAVGCKLEFMPALDGEGVVAIGYSSSRLDREKFAELIQAIVDYGDNHGVHFKGETPNYERIEA